MLRLLVCALVGGVILAAATPNQGLAQKKKVEITKKWSGSVEDEKAIKPEVITSTKGLEAVWKAWKVKGEAPKVDFTTELIVAVYSVGSKLNIAGATLDDKGNLNVLGLGTSDIGPGFRYVLGTVNRKGVKTVNGKDLPKE
jgi:hypothetical protein